MKLVRDTFRACSGEGYALACEALGAADLRALAPRIAAPTLVVCGSEESDAFKDAARWLGEHIAGARVEFVDQAAHASVLEQPVVIRSCCGVPGISAGCVDLDRRTDAYRFLYTQGGLE